MNINKFMARVDRVLGLSAMRLQKYFPTIHTILVDDTLPIFSQFIPMTYQFSLDLNAQAAEQVYGMEQIYYLKDPYLMANKIEVISVEDVTGTNSFSDWNSQPATFSTEDMVIFGEMSSIRSQLGMSFKAFDFIGGNRIKLKGFNGYEQVEIIVKIPYQNMGAVPQSAAIAFEKLALLDIKMALYAELKHYDKLETADGNIDLKIDSWEDAGTQRDELLDNWANKAILDQALGNKKIMQYE